MYTFALYLFSINKNSMILNEESNIGEIIKVNAEAIDVIASVNKHFSKLKNPILRKLLASKVNVRDAARIGNVKPNDILLELQKIGFEIQQETGNVSDNTVLSQINTHEIVKEIPESVHENIVVMDVRPLLDLGTDPFNRIMKQLKNLLPQQQLLIINTFEPVPLINMLKEKGFLYKTSRPVQGEVHTLFYKQIEMYDMPETQPTVYENNDGIFREKTEYFQQKSRAIDVRDLEMPLPMVTILKELEFLEKGFALLVEHKKFPQFLLQELSTRGYNLVSSKINEHHTRLLIYK